MHKNRKKYIKTTQQRKTSLPNWYSAL